MSQLIERHWFKIVVSVAVLAAVIWTANQHVAARGMHQPCPACGSYHTQATRSSYGAPGQPISYDWRIRCFDCGEHSLTAALPPDELALLAWRQSAVDETAFRSGLGSSARPVRPAVPVRMPRHVRRHSPMER